MLKFDGHTTDKDMGAAAILAGIAKAKEVTVDVGIFEGETHPGTEYTVAQIGAVHEFGAPKANILPRPWLSRTADEKNTVWRDRWEKGIDKFLTSGGKIPLVSTLIAFGEKAASDVRRTITAIKDPPKAEATLRREGPQFTNPLIWLGYMRAAVRSRIVVGGGSPTMTPKGSRS